MEITRRCDYACRIVRAAYKQGDSYSSIAQIAKEEDIPYSFARSIQHELVKAGILKTTRGVHGGLALNCDLSELTLKELIEAVQDPVSASPCSVDPEFCHHSDKCSFHAAWCGLDALINSYLSSLVLSDLFELKENHPVIIEAFKQQSHKQSNS